MLRRYALGFSAGRHYSATTAMSATPIEDTMRAKITDALDPCTLEIYNDSHLHAHHKAMVGSTSRETHFRLVITSAAFQEKRQPARHRMVYALLCDEMALEGGIHALQLKTLTPDEEQTQKQRLEEAAKAKVAAAATVQATTAGSPTSAKVQKEAEKTATVPQNDES